MIDRETILINGYEHISFEPHESYSEEIMIQRSKEYLSWLDYEVGTTKEKTSLLIQIQIDKCSPY